MRRNHPSLPSREADLMQVVVDFGPLTGPWLAAEDARRRAQIGRQPETPRATVSLVDAVRWWTGTVLVALGNRLHGAPVVEEIAGLPGEPRLRTAP